jgi:signal transduction histidine kinase
MPSQTARPVPRMLVIKGADEGKQFELTEPVVSIGRDATNKIRLHDTEVSRRHAEFRLADGNHVLVDVGSANGTYVNSKKIKQVTLRAGDQVVIGQTTLVYSAGRADPAQGADDLADKISMITRADVELSSAIIKTIGETEGSRLFTKADQASPWLKNALANLAIMYEASQAVSKILDIGQLLDRILELVFRSIAADRGCFMLVDPDSGELTPKALRWNNQDDHEAKFTLSKTITDHVLKHREGVLVSDAAQDERFNTGQSIVRLGIREVICVPMKGRHETLGVLYLDTHSTAKEVVKRTTTMGKFTEDHLALAIALAHQAALAIEETRYYHAMVNAERLAAIGQTIAALSHHIKNILQGLRSGSEILQLGLAEKNDRLIQQGWRVAEKNQAKIYELVMDMLSYSKEREPALEPTQINDVVNDVAELLAGRAKDGNIDLETKLGDLPIVPVDPEGLHRALLNIMGNALDAVEESAKPKVTVATTAREDGWIHIVVADNGVGIAPQKMEEIFKPFVSTKGAKGTGLGLAVSRKILREHGGDIEVTSQLGAGSEFTLRVPLKSPLNLELSGTGADMPILPPEPD